jgi:hypothetical protein
MRVARDWRNHLCFTALCAGRSSHRYFSVVASLAFGSGLVEELKAMVVFLGEDNDTVKLLGPQNRTAALRRLLFEALPQLGASRSQDLGLRV